ncbi:MAG TPA: pilus assembly protein PilP [Gammaproteobacteria bacterium]|nr:pilus assembly protein PilP [Gammaproteobacteria bacterium]
MIRVTLFVLILILSGCVDKNMDDLRKFTANAYKDRKPQVELLPIIKPHATFLYANAGRVDPFSKKNIYQQKPRKRRRSTSVPDPERRREILEQYPLDSLKMVGTLFQNKNTWVVIEAPDGTVHRASQGNYIGKHSGLITKIQEDKIAIIEKIRDSNDNWITRKAQLSLLN